VAIVIERNGNGVKEVKRQRKKGSGNGLTLYQNQASNKGR
tara:strand:+ start:103 stop:222 length:120 start_codon:yes stop_codon:yes gene_type:complete